MFHLTGAELIFSCAGDSRESAQRFHEGLGFLLFSCAEHFLSQMRRAIMFTP